MSALVLASTSAGRRELLARLGVEFTTCAPVYEEGPVPGLAPAQLALHHALGKARSVAGRTPGRVVIGSDQVATLDGDVLGKPGTVAGAEDQLRRMAGRWVTFHTGLSVVRDGEERSCVEPFRVRLRHLSPAAISAYVAAERPLQCAGSFRVEGLGIALMEELQGRDYTALIGLPLISLTGLLGDLGVEVLAGLATGSQLPR
ncbi:MAG TPA: nucleoside triphosphate pyrophosphatase [Deferrisomatales bacterium]|nr:nucleoside triphosphate pyrophosphatase [Deferrisomatales bacterium]